MQQLKEVINKKVTEMFDKKSSVITIPKFQEFLVMEFKKKSILTSYKNDNIPVPKKGLTVNGKRKRKG